MTDVNTVVAETLSEIKNLGEPPRVCRRPYLLRGWGYDEEDVEPVFA